MIILETSNLYLKTIEKEDTDTLYEKIFSNDETMKYTFGEKAFTKEETRKFVYNNFCKNNAKVGLASLFEKKSGLLIGVAGVLESKEIEKGSSTFEFGFIITEEFRRLGYAKEVAEAQIIFAKKQLRQKKIYALVHPENSICKNLIEKIGLKHEKNITTKSRGERAVYSKKL